jgi:alkanesulfonate monooxygenase SsuD/methylene tetrahydromethanopterin reductase-like flavin-dependent oxidoreductase (luciferase family)
MICIDSAVGQSPCGNQAKRVDHDLIDRAAALRCPRHPIYGAETPPERQLQEHRELVQSAALLGFDLIVAGQHFLGTELRYYQPVPYLSYPSTFVPDMTVVTGIMLSMANPVDLAEQIATLDLVTGGKCVFDVGLGYSGREFAAFGVDPKAKVARFEQGLELIKALWSGQRVDYAGDFWAVQDVTSSVLPVQRPHLPIWIGRQSAPAVRRAARFGDAWDAPPFPSHTGLAELREVFLKERARRGHLGRRPGRTRPPTSRSTSSWGRRTTTPGNWPGCAKPPGGRTSSTRRTRRAAARGGHGSARAVRHRGHHAVPVGTHDRRSHATTCLSSSG